jgi:uncharacterized glyoxalase superfamily protein PhnB
MWLVAIIEQHPLVMVLSDSLYGEVNMPDKKLNQADQHPGEKSFPGNIQSNRSMPDPVIIPVLAYPDVDRAVSWLCQAFGFEERLRIGDHRVQLTYNQGTVVVTHLQGKEEGQADALSAERAAPAHSIMVRVLEIDAHYERVTRYGARVLQPPADYPYGERQYSVLDPGGHTWTFSQTIADIDPASWGGKLIKRRLDSE